MKGFVLFLPTTWTCFSSKYYERDGPSVRNRDRDRWRQRQRARAGDREVEVERGVERREKDEVGDERAWWIYWTVFVPATPWKQVRNKIKSLPIISKWKGNELVQPSLLGWVAGVWLSGHSASPARRWWRMRVPFLSFYFIFFQIPSLRGLGQQMWSVSSHVLLLHGGPCSSAQALWIWHFLMALSFWTE